MQEVPENQRADAANSLVYEANVRLRDPVYGCMGAISALQQQVQSLQAELNVVRTEIMRFKYRDQTTIINTTSTNNNNNSTFASHLALLSSGVVSTAAPPAVALPPLPPTSPSLPHTSSSSSIYTPPPTVTADYSTISNDNNVSYFG